MLVPTRGRPQAARELVNAMGETASSGALRTRFLIDRDDPELPGYEALFPLSSRVVQFGVGPPQRIGPWLNSVAPPEAERHDFIGFMGDDHRPRTAGWDAALMQALAPRPGVAYGDDGHQGERLPTACVISSVLIRHLGYMCPPGLEHLYLDDFWKLLGTDVGSLHYLPEVRIEHLHPVAGKAPMDAGYQRTLSPELMQQDGDRFREFARDRWPGDFLHLSEALDRG
jgi:hypothetical protein